MVQSRLEKLLSSLRSDADLQQRAISHFIEQPYAYGWDKECGGLLYFLDVGGHSPLQLEWSMKLWWVHCEALVAWLMAYQSTRKREHWEAFVEVCKFIFSKVLLVVDHLFCIYFDYIYVWGQI